MRALWRALGHLLCTTLRRRLSLQLEVIALRHQLSVYERNRSRRIRIDAGDRALWSLLARLWPEWRQGLRFVQPRTVLEWQKRRFRDHWCHRSRGRPGRRAIDPDIRALIRQISRANPGWGSPRVVGELAKIGIVVAMSTVEKYRIRATGCASRIVHQAAMGSWTSPWQCGCQVKREMSARRVVDPPPASIGVLPWSEA